MICFWPLALLLAPTDIYVSLNKDKHAMIFARALGEKMVRQAVIALFFRPSFPPFSPRLAYIANRS